MTDTLLVVLEDAVAGTLSRLRGGQLRFDYDEEYRARAGATPLSLSMPTQVPSHADHVVTPWLWGLLPDNEVVLGRWARHFHVSARSPFSLLSTPVGEDCAGAVRFVAPEEVDRVLGRAGEVDVAHRRGGGAAPSRATRGSRPPGLASPSRASSASPERRRRPRCSSGMGAGAFRPAQRPPPTSSSRRSPDSTITTSTSISAWTPRDGLV